MTQEITGKAIDPLGKKKTRVKNKKLKINAGYLFIAPAVILVALISFYPTFRVVFLSLMDFSRKSSEYTFVGLENYIQFFNNPLFLPLLKQTIAFSFWSTFGHIGFGLIIALVMNSNLNRKFVSISRALFLLPWAISPIVIAMISQIWTHPLLSPVGHLLRMFGSAIDFMPLGRPDQAMAAVSIINIWQFTPFYMLMILSALQTIDPELYEAAKVDGATGIKQLRYITMPLIRNVLLTLTMFDFVTTAAFFDLIWVTTQGGPVRSTEVFATYIYRTGFMSLDWPRAATVSVVLLVMMFIVAILITTLIRKGKK
jgi:ABC-type sugar transport system permease subunit